MQIRIFSVPILSGEMMQDEMNRFLRSVRVVTIDKQVEHQGDASFWTFCVTYIPTETPQTENEIHKPKTDYKKILDAATFEKFSILRSVRKQIADRESIPAYLVLTDAEMAEVAKLDEITPKALLGINGIGEKRVEKYGEELCRQFNQQERQ